MEDGHRRLLDHKRMIGIDKGTGTVLGHGHLQGNIKAVLVAEMVLDLQAESCSRKKTIRAFRARTDRQGRTKYVKASAWLLPAGCRQSWFAAVRSQARLYARSKRHVSETDHVEYQTKC